MVGAQWNEVNMSGRPRKLGLLAGTFEDGSLSIYIVPDPEDVRSQNDTIPPTYGGSLSMISELTGETGSQQCIYPNHFSTLSWRKLLAGLLTGLTVRPSPWDAQMVWPMSSSRIPLINTIPSYRLRRRI